MKPHIPASTRTRKTGSSRLQNLYSSVRFRSPPPILNNLHSAASLRLGLSVRGMSTGSLKRLLAVSSQCSATTNARGCAPIARAISLGLCGPGEPIMGSPVALHLLRRPVHLGWSRVLFKDHFAHELRAHDISNFRPIHIPLHTLLVVNPSSLTKHFVCFLLILLK